MPAPLIAPEKETFPNRIRWTVAECYELANAGHLKGRYELIDGEILSKMGQKPSHRMVLILIATWILSLFGKPQVQEQEPIRIPGDEGRFTEPEPDLAVTSRPTTAYTNQHPGPDDLLVLIEVADSSLEFDLTTKALLYARAGVREYWVADVANRRIHVHRDPAADGYRSLRRADIGEAVALEARPQDQIDVSEFFPASISEDDV